MATMIERIPLERITTEAREVHFARTVATFIAGLLWMLGWAVAKVFGVVWFAAAWSATAVKVGWDEGRKARVAGGG